MKGKYIFLSALTVLIIAVFIMVYSWSFRKSEISVGSKKADFEIEATMLLESFKKDEQL